MSSHRQQCWDEASVGLQSQRAVAAGGELTASLFSEDTGAVWRLGLLAPLYTAGSAQQWKGGRELATHVTFS